MNEDSLLMIDNNEDYYKNKQRFYNHQRAAEAGLCAAKIIPHSDGYWKAERGGKKLTQKLNRKKGKMKC